MQQVVQGSGSSIGEWKLEQFPLTTNEITNGIVVAGNPQSAATLMVAHEGLRISLFLDSGFTYNTDTKTISFASDVQTRSQVNDLVEVRFFEVT